MDPALLKERERFQKRALIIPTVEKKKKNEQEKETAKDESVMVNYKTMTGSSQYKFGVLAKIVKHMKARHLEGDDHPLTLDEILDETKQLDVGTKVKQWLQTEALTNNPKIEATVDSKFVFKPIYKIKDKKSLLRLLKQHDLKGLGGIMLEDLQESLPHCDKHLKSLQNEIIYIVRQQDKKKIIFYNDKTEFSVEEEFKKLWRSVAVDSMDDQKIEEYLERQGITSMQDQGLKKPMPIKRKKPVNKRKQSKKPKDNEHLADVLETYDD